MQIYAVSNNLSNILCDALLIFLFKEKEQNMRLFSEIDNCLDGYIQKMLVDSGANLTKPGEITVIHSLGKISAKKIILIGSESSSVSVDEFRNLIGKAVRSALRQGEETLAIYCGFPEAILDNMVRAAVEGSILGTYCFDKYKTEKQVKQVKQIQLVTECSEREKLQTWIDLGRIVAETVNFSRDLVNHPSCYTTPARLAEYAVELGIQYKLDVSILDYDEICQNKMNAFLAVAKGTEEPPKFIVIKYAGSPKSKEMIAFIGKGITFDSGGISLKPSAGMEEMKTDMAGGAAVLGAMRAIAQLRPKVNILACIPCTENMPSGSAVKPGDVVYTMSGKTVEIINTDAEGRLLLADAVTYAKQAGATKLVDLATLTGACVVALGSITSGVITNNEEWGKAVLAAANHVDEKMWLLPSCKEYKEQIKSKIADMKNSGGRPAGAITAGLFISEFAGETPWVHIDIAGTATTDKDQGYNVKGATGAGIRTLIQLARELSQ